MDRWIAATHFGKDLFGGHATVHEPDPISLAVLVLDLFNKGPQRGFVGGIAAQHLVSQWQALRSDDQGDDCSVARYLRKVSHGNYDGSFGRIGTLNGLV